MMFKFHKTQVQNLEEKNCSSTYNTCSGTDTILFDKLAALYEVERDNRRSVYLVCSCM